MVNPVKKILGKKKCRGYKTVSFNDPYFPGERYEEDVDCYCEECVK